MASGGDDYASHQTRREMGKKVGLILPECKGMRDVRVAYYTRNKEGRRRVTAAGEKNKKIRSISSGFLFVPFLSFVWRPGRERERDGYTGSEEGGGSKKRSLWRVERAPKKALTTHPPPPPVSQFPPFLLLFHSFPSCPIAPIFLFVLIGPLSSSLSPFRFLFLPPFRSDAVSSLFSFLSRL